MDISSEDVIVNSCQYAPVYLIQDPGAIQGNTYVISSSNADQHNPVTNNLKTFYESSGNIENDLLNTSNTAKPSILKKRSNGPVGNSWKLTSFLLPKKEHVNKQYIYNNIVLKPTTTTNTTCAVTHSIPKIDINSKIVEIKDVPIFNRKGPEKRMPKIKPKNPTPINHASKYTSVQLIKLGETYHSLNKLSDEQMKMVNQALNMFNDPNKNTPEPTYDPVTNTQYIYKVVSPKDLAVVGKRKLAKKIKKVEGMETKPESVAEATVTRSGRKVKLPKQILPEGSPQKAKKKSETIVTCSQCSADFSSLYRLQKHYDSHPTHMPAKIHSNLFQCLLAIIKSGSDGEKTNIFIQQLEQLVLKLKSLLPCLLKKVDGTEGQSCTITDDIGRLFGMNPGKYNIDVNALNCVKDKNGHCIHNPPKLNPIKKNNKDLKNKQPRHVSNDVIDPENETENCARINSVAKWPTVSKRIWKLKQHTHELTTKKIKLQPEGLDECAVINVSEIEDIPIDQDNETSAIVPQAQDKDIKEVQINDECNISSPPVNTELYSIGEHSKPKNNHIKFHSAHFDIRSSPIKSSSTVFRKFQINASKFVNYEAQAIRSLGMEDAEHMKGVGVSLSPPCSPPTIDNNSLNDIFKDNVDLSCKESNAMDHELKEWIMSTNEKSQDSFTKSLIEPALLHVKDKDKPLEKVLAERDVALPTDVDSLSNQTESVLNFLDELGKDLAYPETEIRNNVVDFQLDLFTFNT